MPQLILNLKPIDFETLNQNIEIAHILSYISICRVQRKLFEHEAARPGIQTSPETLVLASVNAMKKACVIVILCVLPDPNQNHTECATTCITLNLLFFLHWISLNKMVSSVKLLKHDRAQRFPKQEHRHNDQSGLQHFPYNVTQTTLVLF